MTVELFNLSTFQSRTLRGINAVQFGRLPRLLPIFHGEWIVVRVSNY